MASRSASKLTSKYQTTVPAPVRQALGLSKGDTIVYETEDDGTVTLHKARGLDLEFAAALEPLLSEWDSAEDEEAYRGLS